jgi:hypothetical protein
VPIICPEFPTSVVAAQWASTTMAAASRVTAALSPATIGA